jgi:hypothetical protein
VARRPNFGFEKRQKDIRKQEKRDEKAAKKRLKQELAAGGATSSGTPDIESDRADDLPTAGSGDDT